MKEDSEETKKKTSVKKGTSNSKKTTTTKKSPNSNKPKTTSPKIKTTTKKVPSTEVKEEKVVNSSKIEEVKTYLGLRIYEWLFIIVALIILIVLLVTSCEPKQEETLEYDAEQCEKAVCNSDKSLCYVYGEKGEDDSNILWKGTCINNK